MTNRYDLIVKEILSNQIAQLSVTTFLFFSGYGIYISIAKKKDYIKSFPTRRFLKVYYSFFIAVIIYYLLSLYMQNNYSIKEILLAFTGYTSVGNSNWFMLCTFYMYILTYISFSIFKNNKTNGLLLFVLLSLTYPILLLKLGQYTFYFNTSMCFVFGMIYASFDEKFINIIKNKGSHLLLLLISLATFAILYIYRTHWLIYNIYSIVFVFIIILTTSRFNLKSSILTWIGKNTFNIYILQRIPYMLFSKWGLMDYNIYLYFLVSVLVTIVLAYIYDIFIKKSYNAIMNIGRTNKS